MTHRRTLIRNSVVDILKSAATPAGDRVFGSRIEPLWDVPMPLILVYARDEVSQPISSMPKPMERRVRVAVEARVLLNADVDSALDDMAKAIETAIETDYKLKGKALSSNLVSTDLQVSAEGLKPIGAIQLTYEVLYQE